MDGKRHGKLMEKLLFLHIVTGERQVLVTT